MTNKENCKHLKLKWNTCIACDKNLDLEFSECDHKWVNWDEDEECFVCDSCENVADLAEDDECSGDDSCKNCVPTDGDE